jgi:superfamily II DNA or RNA helicase
MRRGDHAILIQSPTGSGKTALTAHMLGTAASKGMNCWFVVHRRELIVQAKAAFDAINVPHGVIAAGFSPYYKQQIQIASIQTLAHRYQHVPEPALIVWDECHHQAAGSWDRIFRAFPNAYHIGLTATPQRLDGAGLGAWYKSMVEGPTVAWLIENKYLAPYSLYAPASVSTKGIHTRMGDFDRTELVQAIDKPTITGDAIKHYQALADRRRAVAFCVSIQHSKHVAEQFNRVGIIAAHLDGETPLTERDATIKKFRRGEIMVLCNVELFSEGFDLPALECAILLRPTQSLGLYLQQVGRALRPSEYKTDAIILDHAGNCARHGLPDDERKWSLDDKPRTKRGKEALPGVRICKACFAAQKPGVPECRFCGELFEIKPREVEHVDGQLVKVARNDLKRQQGRADSFDALVELGRQRGYKRPYLWAKYVFNARQAKRLKGANV